MKIQKKTLFTGLLILLGLGIMVIIVSNYQKKQALIIAEKQTEIAQELAIASAAKNEATASGWQVFYNLEYTGVPNFRPTATAASAADDFAFLDASQQQIIVVEAASKKFFSLAPPAAAAPTTTIGYQDNQLLAYADGIYLEDGSYTGQWERISPACAAQNVISLIKFDQNYYLTEQTGTIWKVTFADGVWQQTDIRLAQTAANVSDVVIDGYIYLSTDSGLIQYLRGDQTNWHLDTTLTPPVYLTKSADSWFVLTPAAGQIQQFTATWQAAAVFPHDLLTQARWIWLNAAGTQIFVSQDNLLYFYDLTF